ncbi:hypothetical protein [Janthinobacterium agaricidamnosum]|uniref:Uncharacterized protein n=1 Tax=Janthinobacterium agaricidamnosum NBRC 102515 = DSM 9628 TaxID=1349767 RepID=W0V4T3_9BURK|nr:hypothetical protein [Janthinobacterium agaricidamnosum]CDG82282.1 hypothetical protein GJA_1644 [Janthinobacterium agaricidamnosum NBRC 102515 = DSM 9628]
MKLTFPSLSGAQPLSTSPAATPPPVTHPAGTPQRPAEPSRQTRHAGGTAALRLRQMFKASSPSINQLPSGTKIVTDNVEKMTPAERTAVADALGIDSAHLNERGINGEIGAVLDKFQHLWFTPEIAAGQQPMVQYEKNVNLGHLAMLFPKVPVEKLRELDTAMSKANMEIAWDSRRSAMAIQFDGTALNVKDFRQQATTVLGGNGEVMDGASDAAKIVAQMLASEPRAKLELVSGFSLGGASAQVFKAALAAHHPVAAKVPMVLADPQLLNNKQARRAVVEGGQVVDYAQPRGLALTFDYAGSPHRGVMGAMGAAQFNYPGLVKLKLPLQAHDGLDGGEPAASWLGYHGIYPGPIQRFSRQTPPVGGYRGYPEV